MQALLRRNGFHYRTQTQHKTHRTKHHYALLARTIETNAGRLKPTLALMLRQLQGLDGAFTGYEQQIEALAKAPRYQ